MKRANNGMVEGYFGGLKTSLKQNQTQVGHFGKIRVSRYIDFQQKRIEADLQELNGAYATFKHKRTVKKNESQDMVYEKLSSQSENWKNKSTPSRRRKPAFFSNESLSQQNSNH